VVSVRFAVVNGVFMRLKFSYIQAVDKLQKTIRIKAVPFCLLSGLALILLCLATAVPANGQAGTKSVFRFLEVPASPRTAALGGYSISHPVSGVSQFFDNPAYLDERDHRTFSASWVNLIHDVNMYFTSGAWHIDRIGTLGYGIRYLGYGRFDEADEQGNVLSEFSAYDFAISAGLSREVMTGISAGAIVHFIHSSYATYRSSAVAISAGAFWMSPDGYNSAGIAIQHIGTQLTEFDMVREPLPFDIRAGFTRRLENLPLRLSLTLHNTTRWDIPNANDDEEPGIFGAIMRHVTIGGEFLFSDNVNLRLGYNHLQNAELKSRSRLDTSGFSYGLGIRYKSITFDVSRNSFSDLGGVTRIGLTAAL
jgi:hypothetical protein